MSSAGRKRKAQHTLAPQDEIDATRDFTCPIAQKVFPAFKWTTKASFAEGDQPLVPGSLRIDGKTGTVAFLVWDTEDKVLTLAFQGPTSDDCTGFLTSMVQERATPSFLKRVQPDAEVAANILGAFESLIHPIGQLGLAHKISQLTGGVTPRRVLTTGFCMSGAVATLAAVWVALQLPTADVRCITFGSPKLGNHAFADAYRWLVSTSYRMVLIGDPMAERGGGLLHPFVREKGTIVISADHLVLLGVEQKAARTHVKDWKKHCIVQYCKVLKALAGCPKASEPFGSGGGKEEHCRLALGCTEQDPKFEPKDAPAQPMEGVDASKVTPAAAAESESTAAGPSPTEGGGEATTDGAKRMPTVIEGQPHDGSGPHEGETADQRQERLAGRAESLLEGVVEEATGGPALKQRPPAFLTKAFSLLEREDASVDVGHLDTLQKVLAVGKISQAVVIAGAAYENEEDFEAMTGMKSVLLSDSGKTDTQVHVSWIDSGTAIFAFRGTESAQDGLQDLKIVRQRMDYLEATYPGTKAHTGFMQQFSAVLDPDVPEMHIGQVLLKLSGGKVPTRVLCTGHSLGGALATLGAAWAAIEWRDADIRCITFGSPRVGNTRFKEAFRGLVGCSLRVMHGADPVPLLPPSLQYHHVHGAIHVHRSSIHLRSRPWHVKWRPVVSDHFVAKYTSGVYSGVPGGDKLVAAADEARRVAQRAKEELESKVSKAAKSKFGRRITLGFTLRQSLEPEGGSESGDDLAPTESLGTDAPKEPEAKEAAPLEPAQSYSLAHMPPAADPSQRAGRKLARRGSRGGGEGPGRPGPAWWRQVWPKLSAVSAFRGVAAKA